MKARRGLWLAFGVLWSIVGAGPATAQTEWMQPRVRAWYLGGVDGGGLISSNAEEAYLIESISGSTARVVHHTGMAHWTSEPSPASTNSYPTQDMGPVWIHPARLQTVQPGERWMGWEILTIARDQVVPTDYRLLPLDALLAINPQRQIVKMTYRIGAGLFNTGTAYFDAETGLLLYHNAVWTAVKMFFVLAEINYDFARGVALPEDNGPHTGFKSLLSEQGAGGSVIIHSMVESRYGATIQTFVMPSAYPSGLSTAYQSLCFFGDVPVVRRIDWLQSASSPPDQWPAFGQHLYWWVPPTVMGHAVAPLEAAPAPWVSAGAAAASINVFDVPMTKTSDQPLTYTATTTVPRFHFSSLKFDSDGYVTEFSAKDPPSGLDLKPPFIQKVVTVDGPSYFRDTMALPPLPVPGVSSIFPAAGPTSGGTTLTMTGKNFVAGATSVTIGAAAANAVSVQSATSLTCRTPSGPAGKHDVTVITMGGTATASGAFEYFEGAVVTPPADPSQPVTVSVPVPAGTVTATFTGVTAPGWLMVAPLTPPAPPMPQAVFPGSSAYFVDPQGVTYATATFCFPYSEAAIAGAGLDEQTLMVWHQPPGISTWVDVTSSHDPAGHRLCARDSVSQVVIAGVSGPPMTHVRYLAEGATSLRFDASVALLNLSPAAAANAVLRFQRADTSTRVRYVSVPPLGRRTIDVKSVPEMADAEFSTVIEGDQPLVVDRTMTWDAAGYGAHAETSVAAPATTWYLAEGATHSGFNLFYLIQNPHPTHAADVRVRYLLPNGAPIEKGHVVPAHSRYNIWVDYEQVPADSGITPLADTDVSAVIESVNGVAIIVERAMYRDWPGQFFGAGHESTGVTAPALQWFLAEGATGPYFDLFVLIANPSTADASIEATYLLPDGSVLVKPYTVAANSRFNIWVDYDDTRLANTAVSTTIRSTNSVPVIVERAMWWPGDFTQWYEAHNSPGATTTGTAWALAEGAVDTSRALETYLLVANTSTSPAEVRVRLLFEDGGTAENIYRDIPANSRFNVPVGVFFPQADGRRFASIVESLGTEPAQIVVERAVYWNAAGQRWAAGTNALGTKLR